MGTNVSNPSPPSWTPEEEAILHHASFLEELAKRSSAPVQSKALWSQVLDSSVVAALVTTVVGGFFVGGIVASYQDRARKNAESLAEYRQYISKEREVLEAAYEQVGQIAFDSDALISLVQPRFDVEAMDSKSQSGLRKQNDKVIQSHNDTIRQWEVEKYKTSLLIGYYFYGQSSMVSAWRTVQDSAESLMTCSSEAYKNYLDSPEFGSSERELCKSEKDKLTGDLDTFESLAEKSEKFPWQLKTVPAKSDSH